MSRLIRCYQNSALLTDRCEGLITYKEDDENNYTNIEKLIEKNELTNALMLIEEVENKENLDNKQKIKLLLLKSKTLHFKMDYEKAYTFGSNALEISKEVKEPILQFCSLSLMETVILWQQNEKKALTFYSFCCDELEKLKREYPFEVENIKGRYLSLLARAFFPFDKEKAFEYIQESLSLAKKEGNQGIEALVHHIASHMYTDIGKYDEAKEHALESQKINEEFNEEARNLGKLNKLRSNNSQLGYITMRIGDNEGSIYYGTKHREYSIEANDEFSTAYAGFILGTGYGQRGMFRKALEFALEGYEIWIKMGELFGASWCAITAAVNYRKTGELNKALEFYKKTEEINKQLGNEFSIARALQGVGIVYREKGLLQQAESNLKEALDFYRTNMDFWYTRPGRDIARSLYYLVLISLDIGKTKQSLEFLKQLEDYKTNLEIGNPIVEQLYAVSKGIFLVQTSDKDELLEAERTLNQIIEQEGPDIDVTAMAIFTLCGLNIRKIQETKNGIVLFQQTEALLENLLRLAESERSFILLAEVYSLQSQIALVKIEIQEAEKLLIKAQQIAEKGEINTLAMKISNIYDSLLEHLDTWEDFTLHLPSIGEKLELTRMEEMLDELLRFQSLISDVKIEQEEPVLFFISDDTGNTIFAEKFDVDVEESLIQQISIVSKENYRKTLDLENHIPRFRFHEYTVILTSIEDFFFGYGFIGNSYNSVKKLENISKKIRFEEILVNLKQSLLKTGSLQLDDRIKISKIVDEIIIVN